MNASKTVGERMQTLGAIFATLMLFLAMQYSSLRKDRKLRLERQGVDLAEFMKAAELSSIPPHVLEAVFDELLGLLTYPPLASDRISQDLGIDGSDIDDLILCLSERLQITWDHSSQIEAPISTVADLAHFLHEALED